MAPQANKRHRETNQIPETMVPNRNAHCSDTEDNATDSEFDGFWYDSDGNLVDSDLDELDEEEEEEEEDEDELYDSMEWDSDDSSDMYAYAHLSDPMDESESCMGDMHMSKVNAHSMKDAMQNDPDHLMETISLGDTNSSDMSIDPDWISTDDEEAIEEYLVYKEARRQQKKRKNLQCFNQRELEEYDEMDAINVRYWAKGSVAAKGKPCTMTSSAGSAALVDMRRFVLPAREMLRNYFRSTEPNRVVGRSKENAYVSKNFAAGGKGKPNRIVLSEKN